VLCCPFGCCFTSARVAALNLLCCLRLLVLAAVLPFFSCRSFPPPLFPFTGWLAGSDGTIKGGSYEDTGKYQTSKDLQEIIANWKPTSCLPMMFKDRETKTAPARDAIDIPLATDMFQSALAQYPQALVASISRTS
jgi:hypothetical protein